MLDGFPSQRPDGNTANDDGQPGAEPTMIGLHRVFIREGEAGVQPAHERSRYRREPRELDYHPECFN